MRYAQIRFCLGELSISVMAEFIILSIWGWLNNYSQSIISSPQIIGWKQFRQMFSDSRNKHIFQGGGGRGVRPSFLKKFPSFFLVIYLDRRSEGGGSAVPWYIMIYISLYMLSKYLSILIFFFNLSFFYLSVFLSIFFYSYIYRGGGAAVPWYMIIYI